MNFRSFLYQGTESMFILLKLFFFLYSQTNYFDYNLVLQVEKVKWKLNCVPKNSKKELQSWCEGKYNYPTSEYKEDN